jgi:hypothetical protein
MSGQQLAELERDCKRGYGREPVYPRVLVLIRAYRRLVASLPPTEDKGT